MFGFIVGTVCLVAFVAVYKGGRRHRFGWSGRRWLFGKLDTSAAQEKVLRDALLSVKERVRSVTQNQATMRRELADLLRAPSFDGEEVSRWFMARERELGEVRETAVGALAEVHEVLDDQQRKTLAGIIEKGGCWRTRQHGPSHHYQAPEAP